MTPYECIKNCMRQGFHQVSIQTCNNHPSPLFLQRYDKKMVVGLTQGTFCLCGYDYEKKKEANCNFHFKIDQVFSYFVFYFHSG